LKSDENGHRDASKSDENSYRDALKDDESLAIFLRNMKDFDGRFCELMASGREFTLRLEVHGSKGKMIHCRVDSDSFERPATVDRRDDRKAHHRTPALRIAGK
jgi:hypothetical protein